MAELSPEDSGHAVSRLKRLMYGLLYPAVLGSLFVTLLPATATVLRSEFGLKAIVSWLLVGHFMLDYLYAGEIRRYRAVNFLVDLAIVALVYMAFSSVHLGRTQPLEVQKISIGMASVYFGFLLWHYLSRQEIGNYLVLTVYESTVMLWFLLAGILWPENEILLAVGLSVAAIGLFIVGTFVLHDYHGSRTPLRSQGEP